MEKPLGNFKTLNVQKHQNCLRGFGSSEFEFEKNYKN